MIKTSQELKQDELLSQVDWQQIDPLYSLELEAKVLEEKELSSEDLLIAFKRRILESERKYYWSQFAQGTLTAHGVNALVEAIEHALDGDPVIHPREYLDKYWHLPAIAEWLLASPVMHKLFSTWSLNRLSLTYDIARGFLLAQQESLTQLEKLNPEDTIKKQISEELQQNCQQTRQKIAELQNKFPQVTHKLETYIANRLLLNKKRNVIKKLAHSGVLDTPEAERLTQSVERQMERLAQGKPIG